MARRINSEARRTSISWDFTKEEEDCGKLECSNSGSCCKTRCDLNHVWLKPFPNVKSMFPLFDYTHTINISSPQLRKLQTAPTVPSQVSGWGCRSPHRPRTPSAPAAEEWLFTGRRVSAVAVCYANSCCLLPQSLFPVFSVVAYPIIIIRTI